MATGLYLFGWNLLITALLTAIVWLACHAAPLRRRPAFCHALWLLVLVKLVTPPLIAVPVLPGPSQRTADATLALNLPRESEHGREPAMVAAMPPGSALPSPDTGAAQPTTSHEDNLTTSHPTPSSSNGWPSITLALLGVSLLVTVVLWIRATYQFVQVGKYLRSAVPATGRAAAMVDELARILGNRQVPAVVTLDESIMPMLWAVPGRQAIVLPREVADSLEEDQLRSVLGHELAHLARRDGWTQLFAYLVCSLYWWNPCAWLARRELRAAAEACCDALLLERLPNLRKSYARSLLAIVDYVTLGKPLPGVFAVAFGESRALRRRIALVASTNVHSRMSRLGWLALAAAAVVACSFPTRAEDQPADEAPAVADAKPAPQADKPGTATDAPEKTSPKGPQDIKPKEIAGIVVDSDGKPLEGVLVDAWSWYSGDETKTNKDGIFRLIPRDADSRFPELRFSKEGYSPHYIAQQPRGVRDFVVTLGNKTYLEGTLRNPDGLPVAGATIRGEQGPKQGDGVTITSVTTSTTSDANGHYRMYVFPDVYEIQVAVPGVGVARIPNIAVGVDQVKPLDIDLKPGVRFQARVVDASSGQPVEGLVLFSWRDKAVKGVSDAAGQIVIDGMLPGQFSFNVGNGKPMKIQGIDFYQHGEFGRWWSAEAVHDHERKSIDANGWQRNLDELTFELSVGMPAVTIEVERGVVFSGHVYDPDGKPIAGATVAPARTGSGNSLTGDTRYSAKTEKDGSYRAVMPAGNKFAYNLVAHDGDYQQWRKWANTVTEPLETKPGQHFENFDLTLTRGATVRGRVVSTGDRLVGDREVRAHAADVRENRYYDPTVKVRGDGTFELKFIRPGKQFIQVSPFWLSASESPSGTSVQVELKPDEVREGIELVVEPSAEPTSPLLARRTFRVQVVDDAGNPVANPKVLAATRQGPLNLTPLVGDRQGLARRLQNTAVGGQTFVGGTDGVVTLPGVQLFDRHHSAATLVAIGAEAGEAAIGTLYADLKKPELSLRLSPLCEVTAQISSARLPKSDEHAQAMLISGAAILFNAEVTAEQFVAQLPAGDYTLNISHSLANPMPLKITVKRDKPELILEPIELMPARLATLMGQPAPELRGIAAWHNGDPTTLAELRGKVVILDFWGYWCGPCVASMPNLMKLYDDYAGRDVVIIAVHDGTVNSIEQLLKNTQRAKKEIWNDRDLPFLIAVGGGGQAKVEGTEIQVNCQVVADYGIRAFPTTLLIDQQGNLVAHLDHTNPAAAKKQIDRLLDK